MQLGFRLKILIPFSGEVNQWSISGSVVRKWNAKS